LVILKVGGSASALGVSTLIKVEKGLLEQISIIDIHFYLIALFIKKFDSYVVGPLLQLNLVTLGLKKYLD